MSHPTDALTRNQDAADPAPVSASADTALAAVGLDPVAVAELVEAALAEDLGTGGDVTSAATVPADAIASASWTSRVPGVAAGMPVLAAMVDLAVPGATRTIPARDGMTLAPGQVLARVTGSARRLLALERTSLNLLGHLCGVATLTRAWVDAVEGTGAQIRDTRKTLPMLRALDKYAVRCGGGVNHRRGLDDAVLIKDNHVAAAGGVAAALRAVRTAYPRGDLVVQVEVDTLAQLDEALAEHAAQVLLDNFSTDDLREAVRRTRATAPETMLEASGGLTLDRAHEVASTGVDFLAVGALTHSAPALDIGLDTD